MKRNGLSFGTSVRLLLLILVACAGGVQSAKSLSLPAGKEIKVRLNTQLDTGETQVGQTFAGTVAEPVVVNGRTVLAQGASVSGRVTEVVSSGRLKRPASITF